MASALGAIEGITDQKVKIEQYKQNLADIFSRNESHEIMAFLDHSKYD